MEKGLNKDTILIDILRQNDTPKLKIKSAVVWRLSIGKSLPMTAESLVKCRK